MDLASAVQFLLAYEASLKLAPGQTPPPPSPSLSAQLSDAVAAIELEFDKDLYQQFSGLPLSVWSDWPLCCGLDLSAKELKAARSLPPALLRARGLLSLFLALHSCATVKIGEAHCSAPDALFTPLCSRPSNSSARSSVAELTFPSVHLAARVAQRLTNEDIRLQYDIEDYGEDPSDVWEDLLEVPLHILSILSVSLVKLGKGANTMHSVPHEAAGLSLAKEAAALLDAFCGARYAYFSCGFDDEELDKGELDTLPLFMLSRLMLPLGCVIPHHEVCREVAVLSAYDPVLFLSLSHSYPRSSGVWGSSDAACRERRRRDSLLIFWRPLCCWTTLGKVKPADAKFAMSLGLGELQLGNPYEDSWVNPFFAFAIHALHSGLVQPELILRARPQLLEGLIEASAMGYFRSVETSQSITTHLVLLIRSPAVGFHLRKFFSRSGCLQLVQETARADVRQELIRLLGPRAAQSGTLPRWNSSYLPGMINFIGEARDNMRDTEQDMFPGSPIGICEFICRDLPPDFLSDPGNSSLLLSYLSELAEEIAASKRPHARYGVLMVVGLGKACLTLSTAVSGALHVAIQTTPGAKVSVGKVTRPLRVRLVAMGRELSLLRRRVLQELLPLAEAREAALWETVGVDGSDESDSDEEEESEEEEEVTGPMDGAKA